jgi:uncharacterized GH25 family protein
MTADTGRPVPNVVLDCKLREGTSTTTKALQATRFGLCDIVYPPGTTTRLRLSTQSDDFADTSIEWRVDRGESIPKEYTLRLTRAARIGGQVVDAQGAPVAAASVGFSARAPEVAQPRPESHLMAFQATTDAEGRWSINRVAPELLPRLSGAAKHPDHGYAVMSGSPQARQQLLAGTYVFRLVRDVTARGVVVTAGGQPVPEATVGVQSEVTGEGRLGKTVTLADGSFVVPNCRPGKNRLTAIAKGFSPGALETELREDSDPVRLTLQPGRLLRLRVVNKGGAPVPGARVALNHRERETSLALTEEAGQSGLTDGSGRLEWDGLPDREVGIDVRASGYMSVDGSSDRQTFCLAAFLWSGSLRWLRFYLLRRSSPLCDTSVTRL